MRDSTKAEARAIASRRRKTGKNDVSIEEKFAIQELNNRYAQHIDQMQIDQWIAVFAPDGVFDESSMGLGRHVGHDALRAHWDSLKDDVVRQVHLMCNHVIEDVTETTASGKVFALVEALLRSRGRVRLQVFYEDQYVKIDGAWQIKNRIVHNTFEPEVISGPVD